MNWSPLHSLDLFVLTTGWCLESDDPRRRRGPLPQGSAAEVGTARGNPRGAGRGDEWIFTRVGSRGSASSSFLFGRHHSTGPTPLTFLASCFVRRERRRGSAASAVDPRACARMSPGLGVARTPTARRERAEGRQGCARRPGAKGRILEGGLPAAAPAGGGAPPLPRPKKGDNEVPRACALDSGAVGPPLPQEGHGGGKDRGGPAPGPGGLLPSPPGAPRRFGPRPGLVVLGLGARS